MKARDVIPGWPRGTSTSKPWPKILSEWWWPYLRRWSREDRVKLLQEIELEKEYRDGQDRMMDEWYHTGKVKTPTEHLREFWGSGESFELKESSAGDITSSILNDEFARSLGGRHYYEPLEDHTAPTYGGIMRNSATNASWKQIHPFTVASIKEAVDLLKPAEDPQVGIWRKRILEGWEKYGVSGQPLDPRTVEHLAHEFAKPIEYPKVELKLKGWTE